MYSGWNYLLDKDLKFIKEINSKNEIVDKNINKTGEYRET